MLSIFTHCWVQFTPSLLLIINSVRDIPVTEIAVTVISHGRNNFAISQILMEAGFMADKYF